MNQPKELKYIVAIATELARSSYGLSLHEKQLIWLILSKIKPFYTEKRRTEDGVIIYEVEGETLYPDVWYEVSVETYAKVLDLSLDNAYDVLKTAGDSLFNRYVAIKGTHSKKSLLKIHWFSASLYIPEERMFRVKFSDEIIPYLTNLHEHFTQLKLYEAFKISNIYAWKLFDVLCSYRNSKIRELTFTLGELEFLFAASSSYKLYKNMKNKILLPAFALLKEKQLVQVTLKEEIKRGRKVIGVKLSFTFSTKGTTEETAKV